MNAFRQGLTRYFGPGWLDFTAGVRVGVIGAGGLGSNCAAHLLRSGFFRLILADPDTVDASNLNRQFYRVDQIGRLKADALRENLLAIDPDADIVSHPLSVNASNMRALFSACQAVIEAVDRPDMKRLIMETFVPTGCLVVGASGMGGAGLAGSMRPRALGSNCIVVGDHTTPCSAATPPFSPGVGMAAAMQADVVLHHFLHRFQETL